MSPHRLKLHVKIAQASLAGYNIILESTYVELAWSLAYVCHGIEPAMPLILIHPNRSQHRSLMP